MLFLFPDFLVEMSWRRITIGNCGTQDSRVEKGLERILG